MPSNVVIRLCICLCFNTLRYSFQPFRANKKWFSSGTVQEDAAIRGGDKLVLRGLKFHGFHGVKPEEKKLGQKFLIDVDAWMDLRVAGKSDNLSDTISYTEIYRSVITHHLLHFPLSWKLIYQCSSQVLQFSIFTLLPNIYLNWLWLCKSSVLVCPKGKSNTI